MYESQLLAASTSAVGEKASAETVSVAPGCTSMSCSPDTLVVAVTLGMVVAGRPPHPPALGVWKNDSLGNRGLS